MLKRGRAADRCNLSKFFAEIGKERGWEKMKYTYRDECIIRDRTNIIAFCFLAFLICATLGIFLMDAYLIFVKGTDGIGSPVFGGMFALIPFGVAVCLYRDIHKRRVRALAWRRNAMEAGVRYSGRIVEAGKEMESEQYETRDEDGHRETRYVNLPNYWIVVEYFNAEEGKVKRFRAIHFVKSMKRFINCNVDVYVWHEWSEFIHKDLTLTYIDTSGLG